MSDDLKIRMPEWARNMYNRLLAKIDAGGGGGGEENVIESISMNGVNVPPDANKNVALAESDPTVPSWAKQSSKPAYTASEVGALPANTPIPSKTSDLTNDSGFLTSQTGVAGVKGNAENAYRQDNVNLTPANIGAVDKSGDTMTGDLTLSANGGAVTLYPYWDSTNGASLGFYIFAKNTGALNTIFLPLIADNANARNIRLLSDLEPVKVTQGGTDATTILGAVQNLFDTGATPITQYPNKPGIYMTTSNIFAHMNPASSYGVLVIFKDVYGMHLYLDSNTNLYFGFSGDTFGEPSTWRTVTSIVQS